MTTICPLPQHTEVKEFIENLLGKPVSVDDGKPVVLSPKRPSVIAPYLLDDGKVGAIAVCDIEFAACAGGALTMMPVDIVQDSIRQSKIPDNILENFKEVLNVFSGIFNKPDYSHVALSGVLITPLALSRNIVEVIAQPAGRMDFTISIDGYGSGRLSVLVSSA